MWQCQTNWVQTEIACGPYNIKNNNNKKETDVDKFNFSANFLKQMSSSTTDASGGLTSGDYLGLVMIWKAFVIASVGVAVLQYIAIRATKKPRMYGWLTFLQVLFLLSLLVLNVFVSYDTDYVAFRVLFGIYGGYLLYFYFFVWRTGNKWLKDSEKVTANSNPGAPA